MKSISNNLKPAVLTTRQAAQALRCHPKTVRGLCQSGKLRAIKLGSEWRIPTEALEDFVSGKESNQEWRA